MALLTHVAPHPDALVSLLCDQLVSIPEDPFAPELISVPSRGIERWLTQRIASGLAERGVGDGICANIEFPSPYELVHRVLASVPGLASSAAAWEGPPLTAGLLEVIDTAISEPWMWLIARYLEEGHNPGTNRFTAASKIARLFSRYARRRPDMVRAWSAGRDTGPDGAPLGDDSVWQPKLWRLLRDRLDVPSLPELLPGGLDPIRNGEISLDLPPRIAVYGLTSTDGLDLEVLTALAHGHEVEIYVLHPSPRLWIESRARIGTLATERASDPTAGLSRHPLLAAWGRDSRELQSMLALYGAFGEPVQVPEVADTLLRRIQAEVRDNRSPEFVAGLADTVVRGGDRSVQIHVCHGARRQAEVARDAILHLLAGDPSLEPRDMVIMTPDLATFAPLLEAAFPQQTGKSLPDLRLRIADRSPAATNPLILFTAGLLDLAGSRLEANLVRDLVSRPVVQHKFGFDPDTAGDVISVIDDANIAWGLDAGDRARWGAGSVEDRTWGRGLDRALAGVFYADDPTRTVATIAPLDGVEGQDAIPVGILAALIDRLSVIRSLFEHPMPMSEWGVMIGRAVRMLAAPAWGDEWQLDQLERLLSETFPVAGGFDPDVGLAEARRAISSWTDDRPSPLHFRSGDLTVCTLVPMRSVPYRVVCLLGMDDVRFPRGGSSDGDDLAFDHEMVGDTDRGSADRQLLLDAVMAAGDHLVITYSGRDELTNSVLPPAVPVSELNDVVETLVGPAGRQRITTDHPLQSFSGRNFICGELGVPGPWSFDPDQLAGACALRDRTDLASHPPVVWPSPEASDEPIRLGDLIAFLQNPARRFGRARLGFGIPEPGDIPDDTLPAEVGPLGRWQVTDRVLKGLIAAQDLGLLAARERGRDALPPGDLGSGELEGAMGAAEALWDAARERGYDPSRHQPWAGRVEVGTHLIEGTVSADPESAHLAFVSPSEVKGKHRIDAFVRLAFLTAFEPGIEWKSILLGRREDSGHVAVTIGPFRGDEASRRQAAIEELSRFIDLYVEGLRIPLPLPCETGYVWRRKGGGDSYKARMAARDAFEKGTYCESRDPAFQLLFPEVSTLEALEERGFDEYSRRLWLPVLAMTAEKSI